MYSTKPTMLFDQIQDAVEYIRDYTDFIPVAGIIAGTGLSGLSDDLLIACEIEYKNIPHFALSTVQGHKSKLVFGYLKGVPVVVMAGRFHYYEGYTMKQVTFPVYVLKALGINTLIVTNVSGSVNENIEGGDIVIVTDHINLHAENPLRGENDERIGVRFPDMLNTYDKALVKIAIKTARSENFTAHTGVYVGLQGPNLETPAEYKYLHIIGGDIVGMSSVPEVIAARHADLRVCMISIVSNKSYPADIIKDVTLEEVIAMAQTAGPKIQLIIEKIVSKLS
jgi:purine-nucleoside phosphorylase